MVENGKYLYSNGAARLQLNDLPKATTLAHIIPSLPDSLVIIGILCDIGINCTFVSTKVRTHDHITCTIELKGLQDTP